MIHCTLLGPYTLLTCVRPINLLMFSDKKTMSPSDVTTLMKPPSDFRYQLSISLSTSVVSVAVAQAAMGKKTREFENACVHVSVHKLSGLVLALECLADVQNKQQQLHPATPNPPNNTDLPSATALHTRTHTIPTYSEIQTPTMPSCLMALNLCSLSI